MPNAKSKAPFTGLGSTVDYTAEKEEFMKNYVLNQADTVDVMDGIRVAKEAEKAFEFIMDCCYEDWEVYLNSDLPIKEQADVRKALINITEKAELFMEDHSCNDFTEYIRHAREALQNLNPPYKRDYEIPR